MATVVSVAVLLGFVVVFVASIVMATQHAWIAKERVGGLFGWFTFLCVWPALGSIYFFVGYLLVYAAGMICGAILGYFFRAT